MNQFWNIINLDTMKSYGSLGGLDELYYTYFDELIDKIVQTRLPQSPTAAPKKVKIIATVKKTSDGVQPFETTGFGHLPTKLIAEIFSHIEDYADALCLGFTCSFVWDAGLIHIGALYVNIVAPFKGHRIMCIGNNTRDLPPSLSNEASFHKLEAQLLAHNMIPVPSENHCESAEDDYQEADKLHVATTTDLRRRIRQAGYALYNMNEADRFGPCRRFNSLYNVRRSWEFAVWWHPVSDYAVEPAPDELQCGGPNTWVLRNLSKKVYVREDHLSALPKHKHYKYFIYESPRLIRAFGLALFSNFCWSSDDDISMPYDGDLHRGAWAGDAFDIVQLEHLLEQRDAEQWKDVTEYVKKRMIDIWVSEHDEEPLSWERSASQWRIEPPCVPAIND